MGRGLVRLRHVAPVVWLLASPAAATTITLSGASSDETSASVLDATFELSVSYSTLTLKVANDTADPDAYNINQVFFNGAGNVSALTLTSATHSVEGDVMSEWGPVETSVMVDGFDGFDFGLTDGMGMTDPSVIGPSEFVTFVFSISGTQPFAAEDFEQPN